MQKDIIGEEKARNILRSSTGLMMWKERGMEGLKGTTVQAEGKSWS
jgi:hypothetical protein